MYRRTTYVVLATVLFVVAAAPALAGKGGKGGNGSSSSITLVVLEGEVNALSTEAVSASHGDQVTFDVQTTATDRPYVLLDCYQGGEWVYTAQGFYSASSPPVFTLSSSAWPGGDAACTARAGELNADGTKYRELASTSFAVFA